MPYPGPGLPYKPEEERLVGFESLMPVDDRPGVVARFSSRIARVVTLPFRLVGAVVRVPLRLIRRRSVAAAPSQTSDKD